MKTEDLGSALTHAHDFEHVCEAFADSFLTRPFVTYLYALMDKYGLQKSDLITRANLEKSYAYQIFRGERQPSRDKLLQIAFGLGCDLAETQRLLQLSERGALYPRVKRDAALWFCLQNRYTLDDCQLFLQQHGFALLKE